MFLYWEELETLANKRIEIRFISSAPERANFISRDNNTLK